MGNRNLSLHHTTKCKAMQTRCQWDETSLLTCPRCWEVILGSPSHLPQPKHTHTWAEGKKSPLALSCSPTTPDVELTLACCFTHAPLPWPVHLGKKKNKSLSFKYWGNPATRDTGNIFTPQIGKETVSHPIYVMHPDIQWFVCSETVK